MKRYLLILFCSGVLNCFSQSTLTIGSTVVTIDTVYTGLDVPWEVIYADDNHLWLTERKGLVSRINPLTKTKTVILDIQSQVFASAESGLLGMALHPNFTVSSEVFLVYTYGTTFNVHERLVKYQYINGLLVNPAILIDSIPGMNAHDGSRLLFMEDQTLLMTTGDAHILTSPQSTSAINGKVLRLNTDGSVPADNPFAGSYTWSFGHRNVQGLMRAPDGKYYISEHGTATNDEFQLLEKGRNYGWPNVEGFCDLPAEVTFCAANNVKEPLFGWSPTIAPNDLVFYSNNSFPEFDGRFIMTTLKNKQLVAIKLNTSGTYSSQATYLTGMFGRLRDICTGPAQEIFLATNGADASNNDPGTHSIIRITPPTPTVGLLKQEDTNVAVFPTFTSSNITVNLEMGCTGTATIFDITGRKCLSEKIAGESRLTVASLPEGIYFIEIETGNQVSRFRFVKYSN